ncbi:MAG TPA: phosphatase PAP2 family protein [Candidatus Acidoferrales bacterium]|nr:phosphatase PAP2 family protein [Candidatus Acidoferrales bacterium]
MRRILGLSLSVLSAWCFIYLALHPGFYATSINSEFFAPSLFIAALVHCLLRPRREMFAVAALASLLLIGDFAHLGVRPTFSSVLSMVGLASLILLPFTAVVERDREVRKRVLIGFFVSLVFAVSYFFAGNMLDYTARRNPMVLDLYLYSFDCSLGFQPSFAMGQLFGGWFGKVSLWFYIGLPIPLALVFVQQLRRASRVALDSGLAFLIAGPLGVLFYNQFPAVGPVHVFQGFPVPRLSVAQVAHLRLEAIPATAPRNAMPSLHMGWIILAMFYARGLSRPVRIFTWVFCFFVFCATLGTGEHYLVDLVASFPFVLLIASACAFELPLKTPSRIFGILFGLGLLEAWFSVLRNYIPLMWQNMSLPWVLTLGTIFCCLIAQRWLMRDVIATEASRSLNATSAGALAQVAAEGSRQPAE